MQIRIPFYSLHHSHVAYIYILIPEVDAISGEYRAADRSAGQTELKKKKKKSRCGQLGRRRRHLNGQQIKYFVGRGGSCLSERCENQWAPEGAAVL